MQAATLIEYFDQLYIIHLPSRTDRYRTLKRELERIRISISGSKVSIPRAPVTQEARGFPSPGVLGNFLSHFEILKDAERNAYEKILVLEDDAIFRECLRKPHEQAKVVTSLQSQEWGMCFIGHPLTVELIGKPQGLIPYRSHFKWAHCYAVHRSALSTLLGYLKDTMEHPAGHPRGGKMYIDAAFSMFRDFFPCVEVLVANPCLSVQRGCPSSLSHAQWYDKVPAFRDIAQGVRVVRDEIWRQRVRSLAWR